MVTARELIKIVGNATGKPKRKTETMLNKSIEVTG